MLCRLHLGKSCENLFKEGRKVLLLASRYNVTPILAQNRRDSLLHQGFALWTSYNGLYSKSSSFTTCKTFLPVIKHRFYARGSTPASHSIKNWRNRLWSVVRAVFLTTGGLVWFVALVAYIALDKVSVNVYDKDRETANAFEKTMQDHFYKEKSEAEILKKEDALEKIVLKLRKEDRIKEVLGDPVYICGYNYKYANNLQLLTQSESHEDKGKSLPKQDDGDLGERVDKEPMEIFEDEVKIADSTKWEAACYLEGPKKVGLLDVKFEKQKQEWVPVSLHLETLEKSGQVVCDISGTLPNGVKNFTRLSN